MAWQRLLRLLLLAHLTVTAAIIHHPPSAGARLADVPPHMARSRREASRTRRSRPSSVPFLSRVLHVGLNAAHVLNIGILLRTLSYSPWAASQVMPTPLFSMFVVMIVRKSFVSVSTEVDVADRLIARGLTGRNCASVAAALKRHRIWGCRSAKWIPSA